MDEFSQFARFPAAQPVRRDLNEVVEKRWPCSQDRLDGIAIQTSFAPGLPPVNLDREQFKRVVVNLVDNAAEAMQDSLVKKLYIATQPGAARDGGAGGRRLRLRRVSRKIRRSCSCPTSRPRIAAPAWGSRS